MAQTQINACQCGQRQRERESETVRGRTGTREDVRKESHKIFVCQTVLLTSPTVQIPQEKYTRHFTKTATVALLIY